MTTELLVRPPSAPAGRSTAALRTGTALVLAGVAASWSG